MSRLLCSCLFDAIYDCIFAGCEVRVDSAMSSSMLGGVDTSDLVNGDVMLGLLVWLIVLSVMFLFVAVCSCKLCRDQENEKRTHLYHIQDIYRSLPNSPRNIPYRELPATNSNNNFNHAEGDTLSYT